MAVFRLSEAFPEPMLLMVTVDGVYILNACSLESGLADPKKNSSTSRCSSRIVLDNDDSRLSSN